MSIFDISCKHYYRKWWYKGHKKLKKMSKSCKCIPKTCCERYKRHLRDFANADKSKIVKRAVKKNICSNSEKCCSTGIINKNKESKITTPKKTTKSDLSFNHLSNNIDYCKTCGDVASRADNRSISSAKTERNQIGDHYNMSFNKISQSSLNFNNQKKHIHQFYKNENYKSTHSFNTTDNKKVYLNTILEQSEKVSDTEKSIFEVYPDSDEEITFMDPDDYKNLENIKEFRNKNYFECHSAKSRISKSNVAGVHKCVYRFYLNERLFPVPLNADHKGNIRCIECCLPLDKKGHDFKKNGTVQAKVRINGEVQDMLLMLPVNDSLIIKERKEVQNKEDESIYFGIIKLDLNGNSIFNKTLPEDSLALRYQKGYKEFSRSEKYEYESVGNNDVIII